ncbi:HAD family hydrolase [Gemmatimonas sp.]|uniref:HAD family hydrolase n=1 Tax=Gemmatimonas sp. TaxID=1962908 RepID=UPI003F70069E
MVSARSFDTVLFDVGGTLLHVERDPRERLFERLTRMAPIAQSAWRDAVSQAVREWTAAGGPAHAVDLTATWVAHFERALTLTQFPGDVAATARDLEATFLIDGWSVNPDVHACLARLRLHGIRLGIVSNWPETLGETLEHAGLLDYFEVIVASGTVGHAKPHPAIFHAALRQFDQASRHVLHVGDNVTHDVEGAQAAGLDALLLDRARVHTNRSCIASLADLPALLGLDA